MSKPHPDDALRMLKQELDMARIAATELVEYVQQITECVEVIDEQRKNS